MGLWDFFKKRKSTDKPAEQPAPAPKFQPALPPALPANIDVTPATPPSTEYPPNDFLPIQRNELLAQAKEIRRTTGWMFFGRRDLIPPANDPRTKLIDQGMVSQGILTPEQIAEMHRVGDEHFKHANRLEQINIQAGKTAEQAVEADRAARAAIKAQKKAEAAAKKAKRAEGIAHRKASDIRFVGRGVSALMNHRDSNSELLTAANLPVLDTPAKLAQALLIPVSRLRWLCFHTEAAMRMHYVTFEIPKKSGGTRQLSAPHKSLASAQEWILNNILFKLPTEDAAHGFVPGRSTVTNALPHAGKEVVINVDLEAFFPSIGFGRVRAMFRRLGYSGAISTLLALLCTECPRKKVVYDGVTYYVATGPRGLPQGACTSPAISNQIARRLDRRLTPWMTKAGFTYTRYADDLTFSTSTESPDTVARVLSRVETICEEEGFRINRKKTRVQRPQTRQTVTGLVVNVAPAVPRDIVRRVRAILHHAKTEGLDAQNREGHPNFRAWLGGMIDYIAMVKPQLGAKFREELLRM